MQLQQRASTRRATGYTTAALCTVATIMTAAVAATQGEGKMRQGRLRVGSEVREEERLEAKPAHLARGRRDRYSPSPPSFLLQPSF